MKAESHVGVAGAEVRARRLSRHLAQRYDRGRLFLVAGAIGRPRLWSYALDAVGQGFEEGIEQRKRGEGQLQHAVDSARARLAAACDALIERELPDAHLIAGALIEDRLQVIAAGPCRAYIHRRGQPQRLTPKEETERGLLETQPSINEAPLEPDDIVLFGSVSAFSVRAIARLASVLDADPQTPPSVLTSLLTEPAAKAGVGAAAIVLRIR